MVVYIFQKVASADDKEAKPIHVPVRRRPLRGDYAEYFASTDKGYITNELWDSVVGHFLNTITPVMNGAEGLFLLDRHISHYTPRILRKLLENRIHSLFLPAHMTHFTDFDLTSLTNKSRFASTNQPSPRHHLRSLAHI
jgi:hypothetical protein